jgi:hypothetical protein
MLYSAGIGTLSHIGAIRFTGRSLVGAVWEIGAVG